MERRKFLQLAGGAAIAWPLPALAQQVASLPLVAVITQFAEQQATARTVQLREGLKQAGLVEGKDYLFVEGTSQAGDKSQERESEEASHIDCEYWRRVGPVNQRTHPGSIRRRQTDRVCPTRAEVCPLRRLRQRRRGPREGGKNRRRTHASDLRHHGDRPQPGGRIVPLRKGGLPRPMHRGGESERRPRHARIDSDRCHLKGQHGRFRCGVKRAASA